MKKIHPIIVLFFCLSICGFPELANAQENDTRLERRKTPLLTIKGSVLDAVSMTPVAKVNIEITGGSYTTTNKGGEFSIRARVGDELVIRHASFETKYYTIKDNQRIRVEVQPNPQDFEYESSAAKSPREAKKKLEGENNFEGYLVKALMTYKKDANEGIDHVATALEVAEKGELGNAQRAKAFKVLGDIYTFWKQYDLAVTNYRLSLRNQANMDVEITLGSAYFLSKNYQESISLFGALKAKKVSDHQLQLISEGYADALQATGDFDGAIANYMEATKLAQAGNRISDATRLNAKIAEAYERSGATQQAINFYDEALDLSDDESSENTVRTQVQAADFFGRNQLYKEEIELRKEALNNISSIRLDTLSNSDAITPQKQNYKIANAYAAQEKLSEAIPFFEKSIEEAAGKEDVVVEKDATRRLSELYRDMGDFDKAAESYERYVSLLDESYAKKEQEIAQTARFQKEIAENMNRILSLEKDTELNENRYQLAFQEQELAEARDNRQRLIIGTLGLVALLLTITAVVMFRSNKKQKFANNVLALRGLRSQMNPHFIFNALNSVNSFIANNDERTANKYLADFSSLMRSVLENSEQDFIPLSDEIELLKKYVMLEHFRFKDKFEYTFTVDDNLAVADFQIPPMLLQPYVENAVWHGLRYKEEMGHLHIRFTQKDKNTALVILTDDGVGREKSKAMKTENQKKQKSKGMGNIKKRIDILNEMYDDKVDVHIEDVHDTGEGTRVLLTLKKD